MRKSNCIMFCDGIFPPCMEGMECRDDCGSYEPSPPPRNQKTILNRRKRDLAKARKNLPPAKVFENNYPSGLHELPFPEFAKLTKFRIENIGFTLSEFYTNEKRESKKTRIARFVESWDISFSKARWFVNFCERN